MKILLISSYYHPSAGSSILYRLKQALENEGHIAKILTIDDPRVSYQNVDLIMVPHTKRARLFHWRFFSRIRLFIQKTIPGLFDFYGFNAALQREVKSFDPDVINVHWTHGSLYIPLTFLPYLAKKKPVYWTLHDMWILLGRETFEIPTYEEKHYKHHRNKWDASITPWWKEKITLCNTVLKEHILRSQNIYAITPSNWLRQKTVERNIFGKDMVHHIPNGLDTSRYIRGSECNAKQTFCIPQSQTVILSLSTPSNFPRKGYNFIIEMAQKLWNDVPEKRSEITFLFIGKHSREAVSAIKFPVIFVERPLDEDLMVEAYSASSVFVLPSLAENLPSTVMESMSCGTPVVAFEAGGISELISDGCGFVVPVGDVGALARAVITLIQDNHLWQRMSQDGREKIVKYFPDDLQAQRYLALFQKSFSNGFFHEDT